MIFHSMMFQQGKSIDSIHIGIHQIVTMEDIYHKGLDTHIIFHYTKTQEDKSNQHIIDHSIFDSKDKLDHHKFVERQGKQDLKDIRIGY